MKHLFYKFKETVKRKYFLIPFLTLSFVCFLVFISGLNKPHLNPFSGSLTTLYPSAASYSDSGSQLVDSNRKRLLICNADDELTAVADAGMYGCPVDKFTAVASFHDRIFVIGSTSYNHGLYLSSEKITEYDTNGNLVGTLYSETYTEEDRESTAHFSNLTAADDGIYLTKTEGSKLTVVFLSDAGGEIFETFTAKLPETVYAAGYDPCENYCIAVGISRNCYRISCDTGEITAESYKSYLESLLKLNDAGSGGADIESLSGCLSIPAIASGTDGESGYYCILDSENGIKLVLGNGICRQDVLSAVEYSTALRLRTVCFWLPAAVFLTEMLSLAIWLLAVKGGTRSMKALFLVGIIMLVSFLYTDRLNAASEENYITSLKTQSGQISRTLGTFYGDTFEEIQSKGVRKYCADAGNQAEIEELCTILRELSNVNDSEHSVYIGTYLYDSDGVLYTFADSNHSFTAGEPVIFSERVTKMLSENMQGTVTQEDFSETIVYNYERIYARDGSVTGMIFISGLRGNLLYVQARDTINLTVSITALLIGIYMLYTMAGTFSADLTRRRNRDSGDTDGKSLDLAGILSFTKNVVYLLDSAIVVYVAKSLCHDCSPSSEALLVSLPVSAITFGAMAGLSASTLLRRRIGDRSTAVLSAAVTMADMILLAFSVRISSIWLYTAGSFIKGFFLCGVLYALIRTIPLRAKTDSGRRTVLDSVSKGTLSSSVLAVLAGGYVSRYMSYYSVYILGAAVSVILLFVCLLAFVKKPGDSMASSDTGAGKPAGFEYWTFFLKGPGLVYIICCIIPWSITCGYGKYLFPLYSSEAGISALLLSNMTVFVHSFTFLAMEPLRKLLRKLDNVMAIVIPQFVTCICLICFILSPNIYWAITVLFISELMAKSQMEPLWMYVTSLAEARGLNAGRICSNELSAENIFNTVRTPLLSAAVSIGIYNACTAVGAVCGCLSALLLLFRKAGKKKQDNV